MVRNELPPFYEIAHTALSAVGVEMPIGLPVAVTEREKKAEELVSGKGRNRPRRARSARARRARRGDDPASPLFRPRADAQRADVLV